MRSMIRGIVAILIGIFVFVVVAARSEAIPAWSRKYSVDCSACHYPNPPRLNTYGHEFRRAGFRAPDEFNKDVDVSNASHYIAVRIRPRFVVSKPDGGKTKTDFQLNDVTLFYAGPISSHFSAFAEISFSDVDETEILGQVSGIKGEPQGYWTFRAGSAHVLSRVGFGGFDRPTGISTTTVQTANLTDNGVPFKVNSDQRFLEVTRVNGWNRVIFQVLNGINPEGIGNEGRSFDTDNGKDVSVVYERILDDRASGFTAYTYFGRASIPGTIDPAVNHFPGTGDFRFYRYGATANKIFGKGVELQGGYIYAKDNPPGTASDMNGYGLYLDVEKYFAKPNFTIFGRYDHIDGNTDVDNNLRRQYILGFAKDIVNNTRLAAEAAWVNSQKTDKTDFRLTTEIMVNF